MKRSISLYVSMRNYFTAIVCLYTGCLKILMGKIYKKMIIKKWRSSIENCDFFFSKHYQVRQKYNKKPNFMLIQLFSCIDLRYTFELFVSRMLLYYTLLPSNLMREFNFQSLIKVLWIQKTWILFQFFRCISSSGKLS